jgi:4-hydroxybenzoate polyprenyltransferase
VKSVAAWPAATLGLARACHPEPALAVTALATVLAATSGRSAAGTIAVTVAVLAGQLSVGWSNDYLDADRDARVGRADKPVASGQVGKTTVGVAAVAALVACGPLSLLSGWRAALVHLVAVGLAWAYNLGLKATAFSVVPYAVAFALLPAFVVLGLPGQPAPPWWAMVAGTLIGIGAHLANVLPDLDDDAATGVRGLPHRLGERRCRAGAGACLAAASAVLAFAPHQNGPSPLVVVAFVAATALAVVGLVAEPVAGPVLARIGGRAGAMRVTIAVAAIDVVLLVAAGSALAP